MRYLSIFYRFYSPCVRLRRYQYRRAYRSFVTLNMIDQSQYNIGVLAEALEQYCPGGYHPIHLNNLLKDGQYEVLHKLGFGSFATVWLARDNQ